MTSLGLLQYSEISDNSNEKKPVRHNTTIKKKHDNVQTMLKLINNTNGYDNEDDSGLADFNPPPRAEVSSKVPEPTALPQNQEPPPSSAQTAMPENAMDYEKPTIIQNTNDLKAVNPRHYPIPYEEGFKAKTYAPDYYRQPYFNQPNSVENKNQLLEKLNYMIHLLEEQKDEKTGHVLEEIILYSFLGVFIIFIVDSFARVGKYTR